MIWLSVSPLARLARQFSIACSTAARPSGVGLKVAIFFLAEHEAPPTIAGLGAQIWMVFGHGGRYASPATQGKAARRARAQTSRLGLQRPSRATTIVSQRRGAVKGERAGELILYYGLSLVLNRLCFLASPVVSIEADPALKLARNSGQKYLSLVRSTGWADSGRR
jgi:hypothetical protein